MEPREIARAYVESFASADPDLIAGFVSEDFLNRHTSALGDGCTGRAAYRGRLPNFLRSFAGLTYEIEDVIADGEHVAVAYVLHADHDGHTLEIPGVFRLVVRDGSIIERTDYFDSLTFLRQTGQS